LTDTSLYIYNIWAYTFTVSNRRFVHVANFWVPFGSVNKHVQ